MKTANLLSNHYAWHNLPRINGFQVGLHIHRFGSWHCRTNSMNTMFQVDVLDKYQSCKHVEADTTQSNPIHTKSRLVCDIIRLEIVRLLDTDTQDVKTILITNVALHTQSVYHSFSTVPREFPPNCLVPKSHIRLEVEWDVNHLWIRFLQRSKHFIYMQRRHRFFMRRIMRMRGNKTGSQNLP